jgi:hypothetical protein
VKSPLTTPFPTEDWRALLDIPHNRQVAVRPMGMDLWDKSGAGCRTG